MNTPRIFAFDPGLALCGWACVEGQRAIDYGAISTPAKTPTGDRLSELRQDAIALLRHHKPDVVAYENPFFLGKNTNAHMVLWAVGVLLEAMSVCGHSAPIAITTSQVKKYATGNGKADKKIIKPAVLLYYGIEHRAKTPDDAYDALAGAIAVQELLKLDAA